MAFLFGGAREAGAKNPIRDLQTQVRGSVRASDRELLRIEREEKALLAQLKKCGSAERIDEARVKARELVRVRAHRARLSGLKTGLSGLARQLGEMGSSHRMQETLAQTTLMLQRLNGQLGLAGTQRMMMEFERQSSQLSAKQEVVDDALESAFEADNEQADADDAVLRVLEEAGLEEACRVFRFKTQQPDGEPSIEDLDSRLRAIRSL